MQLNMLFRLRWAVSLLLGMIFTHSVSALIVDFSTTPSSGPAPLFVTLSVRNRASPSPGFYINGFQWEVTGPETIQLPGTSDIVVELKQVGEYIIKLTLTEFALQVDPNTGIASIPVTNTGTKTKTVTVLSPVSEPTTSTPTPRPTPTPTQQTPIPSQPSDFTNPFTQNGPTTPTPTVTQTTVPEPSFTASPLSGQAPLAVNLSVNNPSSTLTYSWRVNFLSGPTTAPVIPPGSSSKVTLTQVGNYSVTVTATDNQGNSRQSDPKIITVLSSGVVVPNPNPNPNPNQTTPVANFTATPTFGNAPLTVSLDGSQSTSSSGTVITSYQWQSNDGQTIANAQRTSITYTQPGTYTIGLTVTNSAGSPSTLTSKTITVNKAQVSTPKASFAVTPTSGFAPLTVSLDGSQSTSSSGTITSYQWQSNGQVKSGKTTSITYTQPGTYTIGLTVVNNLGMSSTTTRKTIVVNEAPVPTASFTAIPTSGDAPLTVSLDGSQSTSPSGTITSYQWQSSDGQAKSGQNTSMTYTQAGTYTISLIVTDSAGLSSTSTTQTIVVNEAPVPTASFTATPTSGTAPFTVNLDASNSTGNGITYQWTRSDGIAINETGPTVPTTFENGGTYTITLTITDRSGKQDQDERTITIVPKLKPRFTVATNPALLNNYTLDASNSTVSGNTTYTWEIDEQPQGNASSLTTTLNEGVHKLELALSDNFGQLESLGHYIYVPKTQLNPIPRFTATQEGQQLLFDASSSFDPDGGSIVSYQWIFGGTTWSTEPTFLYQPTASTDITLIVTDDDVGTASESVTARITVENGNIVINPVANFQTYDVKVENNKILSTMAFDISGSFHPNPEKNESLKPPEWFIGASENNCTPAANQDLLRVDVDETDSVIHNIRFTKGGNYFLCLKVTDEDGREDTKGITVKMANAYADADDAPSFNGNQGGQPIKGGVLIKDQFLPKGSAVSVSNNTFVDIVAEMTSVGFPNNGGSIDVYVIVALENQFYMMDAEIERFRVWNGQPGNLVPAYKEMPFSNGKIHIPIFSGKMKDVIPAGTYQVFVGYDWNELSLNLNRAIYTTEPISFTVVDDSP
ncbi:surface layer protein [Beggiatoa sp. PS]|nr:surface layer protein [Beggiatoa sp. PS]